VKELTPGYAKKKSRQKIYHDRQACWCTWFSCECGHEFSRRRKATLHINGYFMINRSIVYCPKCNEGKCTREFKRTRLTFLRFVDMYEEISAIRREELLCIP